MMQNMVNQSYISRMFDLHEALDDLRHEYEPMPDDAMDCLTEALSIILAAIVESPVASESDIADKFRIVANLIEEEAGDMAAEPGALDRAMSDLAAWRNADWQRNYGRPHPWYAEWSA